MQPHARFLIGLAAGAAATAALLAGAVEGLRAAAPEHLPPPALSNRIDFDEKLRVLRETGLPDPEMVAVGSSITLQHFDGSAFGPPGRVVNGGTWGLQVSQGRFLAGWYADLFPRLRTVVAMIGLADFRDCGDGGGAFFDPADAEAYVRGRASPLRLYARYFDPDGFVGHLTRVAAARRDPEELLRDRWGSQRRTPETSDAGPGDLVYGLIRPDPACLRALRGFAEDMAARGLRFVVVLSPVNPAYFERVEGGAEQMERLREGVLDALSDTPALLIDAHALDRLTRADFLDAFHMRWSAASRVSRRLAAVMQAADADGSGEMRAVQLR